MLMLHRRTIRESSPKKRKRTPSYVHHDVSSFHSLRRETTESINKHSYGSIHHKKQFLRRLDSKQIKNPTYHAELEAIRKLVTDNLVTLTDSELPDGFAFRIPEKEYLGISMGRHSLHGKVTYMNYADNIFLLEPCRENMEQLACYFTYLYPQWYASNRNASFVYANGITGHYKRIPVSSLQPFQFLKLTTPLTLLKQSPTSLNVQNVGFIWNDLMTTPKHVIEDVKNVQNLEDLSTLITKLTGGHNGNDTPIDSHFVDAFLTTCERLNLSYNQYSSLSEKIINKCDTYVNETPFKTTNWYYTVKKILNANGIEFTTIYTDQVYTLILSVALVDIVMPLSLHRNILKYVEYAVDGMSEQEKQAFYTHPEKSEALQTLKHYCLSPSTKSDDVVKFVKEINPVAVASGDERRFKNMETVKMKCDISMELKANKHNFGLMNVKLTQALIHFFERWYLTSTKKWSTMLTELYSGNTSNPAPIQPYEHSKMVERLYSSYGMLYRNSDTETDFEFALCLNILLCHLFPPSSSNTPVGYYVGQVASAHMQRNGFMISSMNAELTLAQGIKPENYEVRKVTFRENDFDTDVESDNDHDFGGGRRITTRRNLRKRSRSRSRSRSHRRSHRRSRLIRTRRASVPKTKTKKMKNKK